MQTRSLAFSLPAALCGALLSVSQLPSQLPPGSILVSSFAAPTWAPGPGGFFFIDLSATPPVPQLVTGLPCELTGACTSPNTPWTGPDFALRLPDSGRIVANGPSWVGVMINAYVLTLNGTAVTTFDVYPLATYTTANGLGSPAAARLVDGRVLLLIDPSSMGAPGPLAGALLGILDPTLPPTHPSAVVPVPVSPIPPGLPNALAVDADRGVAFVAVNVNSVGSTPIYQVPVPGGGTPVTVATVPGIVSSLVLTPEGKLIAGGWSGNTLPRVWRIDPATGSVTQYPQALGGSGSGVNGLWQDSESGDVFVAINPNNTVWRIDPAGVLSLVTSGPTGGWGVLSGIDGYSRLETFGRASGSAPIARWDAAPNPGGPVALGNLAFTLTNPQPSGTVLSVWALGFDQLSPPLTLPTTPAIVLNVQAIATAFTPNGTLLLPLPANTALSGVRILVQCAHADGGAMLSASSGMRVTL